MKKSRDIMVKVCSRCGIVNSEKAEDCESCGAELGAPVSNREAKKLIRQIAKRNEETKNAINAEKYGGTDDESVPQIPMTASRIVIGTVTGLVAAGIVVLMVLSMLFGHEHAGDLIKIDIGALVLLAIALLYCFLPGEMWALSHCFDKMYYKEIPEPSDMGLVLQQVGVAILTLVGGALFTIHLLVLCGVL